MVKIKIPEVKITTLYDAIKQENGNGFDISDEIWDWGTYFECPMTWEECDDYYSACMLLFGLNIKIISRKQDWYSCCKVTEFIEENREAFDKFLNEAYREGCRPCDHERLNADEDEGYYDLYMEAFEHLLIGNFAESDYKLLFTILTKGIEIPGLNIPESEADA